MKISELVTTLNRFKVLEGDIDVLIDGEMEFTVSITTDNETGKRLVYVEQVEE